MKTISLIALLIKHLPEILDLLHVIERRLEEAETDRKVSEDLKAVSEAFKEKDATKLRAIFNS